MDGAEKFVQAFDVVVQQVLEELKESDMPVDTKERIKQVI
jgi:hypothetical protein